MDNERRKEIIEIALDLFVKKGLVGTSSRDLSSAMNLNSGGMYYYFSSKDELIIECATLAIIKLENELIMYARPDILTPDVMFEKLFLKAEKMAPYMRYLVQVCSLTKYKTKMNDVLDALSERYATYANRFANELKIDCKTMERCLCISVTAMTNYMIFGEKSYVMPQIELVVLMLKEALRKRGKTDE